MKKIIHARGGRATSMAAIFTGGAAVLADHRAERAAWQLAVNHSPVVDG